MRRAALLVLISIFLVSCVANEPRTREERAYEANERAAKWHLCDQVYDELNIPWESTHLHGFRGRDHEDWEVRDDIRINDCDRLLCELDLWECE